MGALVCHKLIKPGAGKQAAGHTPHMTDTPRPWIRRRTTQAGIVLLVLLAWTIAAGRWQARDCGTWQSYGLVVSHFGTPGHSEGCEDEPGGAVYTDQYDG